MKFSERSNLTGTAIFGYLSLIELQYLLSAVVRDVSINEGVTSNIIFWTSQVLFVLFITLGAFVLKSFCTNKGGHIKSFLGLVSLFAIIHLLQFGYTYFKFSIFPITVVEKMGDYLDYRKENPMLGLYQSGVSLMMYGVVASVLLFDRETVGTKH